MQTILKRRPTLGWQILIGLAIGIILGVIFYKQAPAISAFQHIGALFIGLIQMIVLPLVISCLTVGVANIGDIQKLGRIGGKTLLYFFTMTLIAIGFGLLAGNLFHFGHLIDIKAIPKTDISSMINTAHQQEGHGAWAVISNIIPSNFFKALSTNNMIAVVFFCVFFGVGTAAIGEKGRIIVDLLRAISEVMFKITDWIMQLSPIGAGALMAATVAQLGLGVLQPLGLFIALAYTTMILFVLIALNLVARLFGFNLLEILRVFKEELILAFSTASSEAVIPKTMAKLQHYGASNSVTSFVIPIGYTFNLDGSAIYQTLAALFLADVYHIPLSFTQQLLLVLLLMVTSKGMAGVPGASFIVLIATISSIGVPVEGLAVIAGIDRLVDMGRTTVNVIGNSVATLVIGKAEKQFDPKQHAAYVKNMADA